MPVDRTLADIGELGLLERLGRLVGPPPEGTVGIGDDAAVIPWGRGPVLATTDSMVEGTHFRTDWFRPEEVGYKSLAANLSDAAAMGGRPTHALVSLVLPPTLPVRSVERLFRGMLELARAQDVLVVGGNLARGDAVAVTVALLGRGDGRKVAPGRVSAVGAGVPDLPGEAAEPRLKVVLVRAKGAL